MLPQLLLPKMVGISKTSSLIATVAYADIFGYPLTRRELIFWLLFHPVSRIRLPVDIQGVHSFVTLRGHQRLVRERLAKQKEQEKKWRIARRASAWLSRVPTIKLIGVTGGLAMNNAKKEDDVDLFFIVSDGTLWVSRLMATILMDILGLRRRPGDKKFADRVCLNMFMSEGSLALETKERDCFTAHEVLQMTPIWERGNAYRKFLHANRWVSRFLPNAWSFKMKNEKLKMKNENQFNKIIFYILEPLAKFFQLWYMRRHRTSEVITDTVIRFHPKDARVWVKRKLASRLARYNIPLDKIFYGR